MELLQSNILDTGSMFMISEKIKNPGYLSGTIGFVASSFILDDSYQNVVNMHSVLIRKGKTGKERLEFCKLRTPIFTFDAENFAKILPSVENRKNFVYIDEQKGQPTNLLDVHSLNFIGWAVAMSSKLKLMSSKCNHSKWPSQNKNPINKIIKLPDYFSEDPEKNLEYFGDLGFRSSFLQEARAMYSGMIKIHLEIDRLKVGCELNAAEFLEYTNRGKFLDKKNAKNEYKFTDDNELLERTVKYYKTAKDSMDKLCVTKKK